MRVRVPSSPLKVYGSNFIDSTHYNIIQPMYHVMSECPICTNPKKAENKFCSYACRNVQINRNKDYSAVVATLKKNNLAKILVREIACEKCGLKIEQKSNTVGRFPENRFCSRKCANTKSHSTETKRKISEGLILSCGGQAKKCMVCEVSLSGTNLKLCSDKCRETFFMKKRIDFYSSKGDLSFYKSLSKFSFGLASYPNYFDISLIERYGWYKAKNHGDNLNGISRDHVMSVVWGYKNDVNPYLLSHPANCQLMQHTKNSSKSCKESITVDELMSRIEAFEILYGRYYLKEYMYERKFSNLLSTIKSKHN